MRRFPTLHFLKPKESERGAALLAAVFLVALMATVGAAATEEIRYAVRRAANVEARDQAYWYALGAEALAQARIAGADGAERRLLEQAAADGRTLAFPIEGGTIAATLSDAQNCFNLNGLMRAGDSRYEEREGAAEEYVRLLVLLDIPPGRARALANAAMDWMDGDVRPRSGGAEDGAYSAAPVPYRAGNTLLAEAEELRAVAGYEEAVFAHIRPYVCAGETSEPSALNVSTLRYDQAPLLAAFFGPELTLEEAQDVIAARPAAGYATITGFLAQPRIAEIQIPEDKQNRLILTSTRFALAADVEYLDARFRLESVISAPPNARPAVVARRFGAAE